MKRKCLMSLIVAGALLAGCNKEEPTPTPPSGGTNTGGSVTTRPSGAATTQPTAGGRATTGPTTRP